MHESKATQHSDCGALLSPPIQILLNHIYTHNLTRLAGGQVRLDVRLSLATRVVASQVLISLIILHNERVFWISVPDSEIFPSVSMSPQTPFYAARIRVCYFRNLLFSYILSRIKHSILRANYSLLLFQTMKWIVSVLTARGQLQAGISTMALRRKRTSCIQWNEERLTGLVASCVGITLWSSVSQPLGRGSVPGPGINYTGPREVLLEFVIYFSN